MAGDLKEEKTSENVFEERAEHLSWKELQNWTTYTQKDVDTIKALKSSASKLLVGPRGAGKSTLLRTAYFQLLKTKDALPVYVNYSKSLALEPIFHKRANALQIFRHWLLLKIVVSVFEAFKEISVESSSLTELYSRAKKIIQSYESGSILDPIEFIISPSALVECLEEWSAQMGATRTVLLLDDAAHAFSQEQQREFFEVIRELRSRKIAFKAAVYPGVTGYSENFHVGHEAGNIEAWYSPENPDYLDSMRKIVEKRLPLEMKQSLHGKEELLDLLALASFGMPRGFLNMLSRLLGIEEGGKRNPTKRVAEQAIADHAESVRGIFLSLAAKLPRYEHFIDVGDGLEAAVIRSIGEYNKGQPLNKKSVVIAIEEPLSAGAEKILNMLEYAGVLRKQGSLSRGVKGRFRRYAAHYGLLISENALGLGQSNSAAHIVSALTNRNAHALTRTKIQSLLGDGYESKLTLNMPPCRSCGAPRVNEDQRFCMKCGAELSTASVYEELLGSSIDRLPIPRRKIADIKANTNISIVQDILIDAGGVTLRTVPYVGFVWASRIKTVAEEFVSV